MFGGDNMIKITNGNIIKDDSQAIVNPVNCVGVMGAGLALQFKKAFPDNYEKYRIACKSNEIRLGVPFITKRNDEQDRYIVNFPTKYHWQYQSNMESIVAGLEELVIQLNMLNIKSIAIPKIGCGLGGLNWEDVMKHIVNVFSTNERIDVKIYV
jgi:O-acetyl-ADP-ribose deacetylase (regulator of RNase III)